MVMHPARAAWLRLETVHAVTYFAPECREAMATIGLRGFWMGYFGARAAPLGPVPAGVVEAVFFNFNPGMVRRSIPDAWTYAEPGAIIEARGTSAAAALCRLFPAAPSVAVRVLPALERAVQAATAAGRPLFAANRELGYADDPVEALWQVCTCLREHRGDGHVAVHANAGLDGCEAHVLFAMDAALPVEILRDNRGWSSGDWDAARARLRARGLLEGFSLSPSGEALCRAIEATTDDLAMEALGAVEDQLGEVVEALDEIVGPLIASGTIPFPNPMGLPKFGETHPTNTGGIWR